MKAQRERVCSILLDTIAMLCKNSVAFQRELKVQGLIGVTIDDDEVFLVQINETCGIAAHDDSDIKKEQTLDTHHNDSVDMSLSVVPLSRQQVVSLPHQQLRRKRQRAETSGQMSGERFESSVAQPSPNIFRNHYRHVKTESGTNEYQHPQSEFIDMNTAHDLHTITTNSLATMSSIVTSTDAGGGDEEFDDQYDIVTDAGDQEQAYEAENLMGDELEGEQEELSWQSPQLGATSSPLYTHGGHQDQLQRMTSHERQQREMISTNRGFVKHRVATTPIRGSQFLSGHQQQQRLTASMSKIQGVRGRATVSSIPRSIPPGGVVGGNASSRRGGRGGGGGNEYVITESSHMCGYQDCGKRFKFKHDLLRHQTKKHGRAPVCRSIRYSHGQGSAGTLGEDYGGQNNGGGYVD